MAGIPALIVCSLIGLFCLVRPLFPIERREISPDGSVHYTSISMFRWDLFDWFDGFRHETHSHERVRYMIYGSPAVYLFTSRHVYALIGNESGVPASVVENWDWSGQPHAFPYYHDYDVGRP